MARRKVEGEDMAAEVNTSGTQTETGSVMENASPASSAIVSSPDGSTIITAPNHRNLSWTKGWDKTSPLSPRDQALTNLVTSPEAPTLTVDDITDRLKDDPAFAGDELLLDPQKVSLRLLHLRKNGLVHHQLKRREYFRRMGVYRPKFQTQGQETQGQA